ncbi:MAG: hypothetical protein JWO06_1450 [Bacteroidota bacterium]|nr:hypothetical protein [Bacteroidota bacterium]
MKKVAIIGGGFSGTMTAVHLILNATDALEITLVNDGPTLCKGVAYNPYSNEHLLNVPAAKMSAFADKPRHFVDWALGQPAYKNQSEEKLADSFLPRRLYGQYLSDIWRQALETLANNVTVKVLNDTVTELNVAGNLVSILLESGKRLQPDICVIATGNHTPRNPEITNMGFYNSRNYFRSPWDIKSVAGLDSTLPVLIVGNGLTMIDTLLGLLEQGFTNKIYTVSPSGFSLQPHKDVAPYQNFAEELNPGSQLHEILALFKKHLKAGKNAGISSAALVDSLRPHTQTIWQNRSAGEKRIFLKRLQPLWNATRHRIPAHIYEKVKQLKATDQLHTYSGKLVDIVEESERVNVTIYDKGTKSNWKLTVARVINCTGPESDILRLDNSFLTKCILDGTIAQDEFKLGINANTASFQVLNNQGDPHPHLFTLGVNLKGVLWESTAVNELREQAKGLAEKIIGLAGQQSLGAT